MNPKMILGMRLVVEDFFFKLAEAVPIHYAQLAR